MERKKYFIGASCRPNHACKSVPTYTGRADDGQGTAGRGRQTFNGSPVAHVMTTFSQTIFMLALRHSNCS